MFRYLSAIAAASCALVLLTAPSRAANFDLVSIHQAADASTTADGNAPDDSDNQSADLTPASIGANAISIDVYSRDIDSTASSSEDYKLTATRLQLDGSIDATDTWGFGGGYADASADSRFHVSIAGQYLLSWDVVGSDGGGDGTSSFAVTLAPSGGPDLMNVSDDLYDYTYYRPHTTAKFFTLQPGDYTLDASISGGSGSFSLSETAGSYKVTLAGPPIVPLPPALYSGLATLAILAGIKLARRQAVQ